MPSRSARAEKPQAVFAIQAEADGRTTLRLSGRLDVQGTGRLWRELEHRLRRSPPAALEVDASAVEYCDGAGLALLRWLSKGKMSGAGGQVVVRGLRPEFEELFQTFSAEDYVKSRPPAAEKSHLAAEVGRAAQGMARDLREEVSFVGEVTAGLAANLFRRKAMRWGEVGRVFEVAGVNALPIVSLISLLVGMIIAFEAAAPFAVFGAQIFIANMLAMIMTRELAPLMTAIILAGRSGSAFAAELGTMKVNEELNALQTMGLDPVRFLIVQRFLAGLMLTPLLTIYAVAVGLAGGVVVMMLMGFSIETIYQQMASTITYKDILIGTAKGVVFGILVAGVGCLRGMQTGKGPSAVGASTTRAVVSGILLIILADALFSVILYALKA
jgi:phospholipid/cholesterol/gamma-HCH transport system permease protein